MAAEPRADSFPVSDPEPDAPVAEPARSRRSLLGAGLAGLAGLVLGSFARPQEADAAAGGALIMGASNSAGTSDTDLYANTTGTTLYVSQAGSGTALRGIANEGIAGFFTSSNGSGVSGVVANNTKYGIYGANDASTHSTGAAIRANGENNNGIYATTADASSHAIKAANTNTGTGYSAGAGIRVLASGGADADFNGYWPAAGEFSGPNGVVSVANEAGGNGVYGYSGSGYGVYGQSNSDAGVFGCSESGFGVYGTNDAASFGNNAAVRAKGEQNHGLVATTANANAHAIVATNTNAGAGYSAGAGIRALAGGGTDADINGLDQWPAAGEFCGANGVVAITSQAGGDGVYAYSDSGDGVLGQSDSSNGVYGTSNSGNGVYGRSISGYGVFGGAGSSSAYGVYSIGNVHVSGDLDVTGTVSKSGGSFKIDHPLDPANKFLYHSFVESPDMKNVYDGVATLDAKGEATVTLPDWFEALNRDFRYQLTSIGQAAPNLHVKSKVHAGAFSIGGGIPGQEISWQLTGIRKDAWANAHRIPVEEEKPAAERGLYLHPVENGQPAAKGIDEVRHAAMKPHASK